MTITTQTTRISATRNERDTSVPFLLNVLNWIAERDRRYREKQKLLSLPDERLEDMGMTRKDANMAFYQQWNRS